VLLVDDDHCIVDLLKEILEEEGYKPDVFYDGNTAVMNVKKKNYQLAIIDYVLPDIKGDEVAEKLRKINSLIGIILVTGYKSTIDSKKLRIFDAVLDKPVDPDLIIKTIQDALIKINDKQSIDKESTKPIQISLIQ
jgi:DNA-binding response OmpR family regulator